MRIDRHKCLDLFKRKVRALYAILPRALAKIPNHVTKLNLPKKAYADAAEWYKVAKKNEGELYLHEHNESSVIYEKPKCFPVFLEGYHDFNTSYKLHSVFKLVLKDAEVHTMQGVVLTHERATIGDVSFAYSRKPIEHPIFRKFKLPNLVRLTGEYGIAHSPSPKNYYHWVHEVVPQLIRCKSLLDEGKIKQIFCCVELSFQRQWLDILGIEMSSIILLRDEIAYSVKTLYVPSMPSRNGVVPPLVFDNLKNATQSIETSNIERRLYIVRESGVRSIEYQNGNKDELLESYGFERLMLEKMSVVDQIRAFKEASVVLTPHGAGVTGITFCKPGTKVIEMHTPFFFNTCYWRVATANHLDYFCLLGGSVEKLAEIPFPVFGASKIEIDLAILENVLMDAGIDKISRN